MMLLSSRFAGAWRARYDEGPFNPHAVMLVFVPVKQMQMDPGSPLRGVRDDGIKAFPDNSTPAA